MTFTSINENALWCDMVCTAGAELTGHKTVMDDMKVSTAMCKCHCVYELFHVCLWGFVQFTLLAYWVSNLIKDTNVIKNCIISVIFFSQTESFWYFKHYVAIIWNATSNIRVTKISPHRSTYQLYTELSARPKDWSQWPDRKISSGNYFAAHVGKGNIHLLHYIHLADFCN